MESITNFIKKTNEVVDDILKVVFWVPLRLTDYFTFKYAIDQQEFTPHNIRVNMYLAARLYLGYDLEDEDYNIDPEGKDRDKYIETMRKAAKLRAERIKAQEEAPWIDLEYLSSIFKDDDGNYLGIGDLLYKPYDFTSSLFKDDDGNYLGIGDLFYKSYNFTAYYTESFLETLKWLHDPNPFVYYGNTKRSLSLARRDLLWEAMQLRKDIELWNAIIEIISYVTGNTDMEKKYTLDVKYEDFIREDFENEVGYIYDKLDNFGDEDGLVAYKYNNYYHDSGGNGGNGGNGGYSDEDKASIVFKFDVKTGNRYFMDYLVRKFSDLSNAERDIMLKLDTYPFSVVGSYYSTYNYFLCRNAGVNYLKYKSVDDTFFIDKMLSYADSNMYEDFLKARFNKNWVDFFNSQEFLNRNYFYNFINPFYNYISDRSYARSRHSRSDPLLMSANLFRNRAYHGDINRGPFVNYPQVRRDLKGLYWDQKERLLRNMSGEVLKTRRLRSSQVRKYFLQERPKKFRYILNFKDKTTVDFKEQYNIFYELFDYYNIASMDPIDKLMSRRRRNFISMNDYQSRLSSRLKSRFQNIEKKTKSDDRSIFVDYINSLRSYLNVENSYKDNDLTKYSFNSIDYLFNNYVKDLNLDQRNKLIESYFFKKNFMGDLFHRLNFSNIDLRSGSRMIKNYIINRAKFYHTGNGYIHNLTDYPITSYYVKYNTYDYISRLKLELLSKMGLNPMNLQNYLEMTKPQGLDYVLSGSFNTYDLFLVLLSSLTILSVSIYHFYMDLEVVLYNLLNDSYLYPWLNPEQKNFYSFWYGSKYFHLDFRSYDLIKNLNVQYDLNNNNLFRNLDIGWDYIKDNYQDVLSSVSSNIYTNDSNIYTTNRFFSDQYSYFIYQSKGVIKLPSYTKTNASMVYFQWDNMPMVDLINHSLATNLFKQYEQFTYNIFKYDVNHLTLLLVKDLYFNFMQSNNGTIIDYLYYSTLDMLSYILIFIFGVLKIVLSLSNPWLITFAGKLSIYNSFSIVDTFVHDPTLLNMKHLFIDVPVWYVKDMYHLNVHNADVMYLNSRHIFEISNMLDSWYLYHYLDNYIRNYYLNSYYDFFINMKQEPNNVGDYCFSVFSLGVYWIVLMPIFHLIRFIIITLFIESFAILSIFLFITCWYIIRFNWVKKYSWVYKDLKIYDIRQWMLKYHKYHYIYTELFVPNTSLLRPYKYRRYNTPYHLSKNVSNKQRKPNLGIWRQPSVPPYSPKKLNWRKKYYSKPDIVSYLHEGPLFFNKEEKEDKSKEGFYKHIFMSNKYLQLQHEMRSTLAKLPLFGSYPNQVNPYYRKSINLFGDFMRKSNLFTNSKDQLIPFILLGKHLDDENNHLSERVSESHFLEQYTKGAKDSNDITSIRYFLLRKYFPFYFRHFSNNSTIKGLIHKGSISSTSSTSHRGKTAFSYQDCNINYKYMIWDGGSYSVFFLPGFTHPEEDYFIDLTLFGKESTDHFRNLTELEGNHYITSDSEYYTNVVDLFEERMEGDEIDLGVLSSFTYGLDYPHHIIVNSFDLVHMIEKHRRMIYMLTNYNPHIHTLFDDKKFRKRIYKTKRSTGRDIDNLTYDTFEELERFYTNTYDLKRHLFLKGGYITRGYSKKTSLNFLGENKLLFGEKHGFLKERKSKKRLVFRRPFVFNDSRIGSIHKDSYQDTSFRTKNFFNSDVMSYKSSLLWYVNFLKGNNLYYFKNKQSFIRDYDLASSPLALDTSLFQLNYMYPNFYYNLIGKSYDFSVEWLKHITLHNNFYRYKDNPDETYINTLWEDDIENSRSLLDDQLDLLDANTFSPERYIDSLTTLSDHPFKWMPNPSNMHSRSSLDDIYKVKNHSTKIKFRTLKSGTFRFARYNLKKLYQGGYNGPRESYKQNIWGGKFYRLINKKLMTKPLKWFKKELKSIRNKNIRRKYNNVHRRHKYNKEYHFFLNGSTLSNRDLILDNYHYDFDPTWVKFSNFLHIKKYSQQYSKYRDNFRFKQENLKEQALAAKQSEIIQTDMFSNASLFSSFFDVFTDLSSSVYSTWLLQQNYNNFKGSKYNYLNSFKHRYLLNNVSLSDWESYEKLARVSDYLNDSDALYRFNQGLDKFPLSLDGLGLRYEYDRYAYGPSIDLRNSRLISREQKKREGIKGTKFVKRVRFPGYPRKFIKKLKKQFGPFRGSGSKSFYTRFNNKRLKSLVIPSADRFGSYIPGFNLDRYMFPNKGLNVIGSTSRDRNLRLESLDDLLSSRILDESIDHINNDVDYVFDIFNMDLNPVLFYKVPDPYKDRWIETQKSILYYNWYDKEPLNQLKQNMIDNYGGSWKYNYLKHLLNSKEYDYIFESNLQYMDDSYFDNQLALDYIERETAGSLMLKDYILYKEKIKSISPNASLFFQDFNPEYIWEYYDFNLVGAIEDEKDDWFALFAVFTFLFFIYRTGTKDDYFRLNNRMFNDTLYDGRIRRRKVGGVRNDKFRLIKLPNRLRKKRLYHYINQAESRISHFGPRFRRRKGRYREFYYGHINSNPHPFTFETPTFLRAKKKFTTYRRVKNTKKHVFYTGSYINTRLNRKRALKYFRPRIKVYNRKRFEDLDKLKKSAPFYYQRAKKPLYSHIKIFDLQEIPRARKNSYRRTNPYRRPYRPPYRRHYKFDFIKTVFLADLQKFFLFIKSLVSTVLGVFITIVCHFIKYPSSFNQFKKTIRFIWQNKFDLIPSLNFLKEYSENYLIPKFLYFIFYLTGNLNSYSKPFTLRRRRARRFWKGYENSSKRNWREPIVVYDALATIFIDKILFPGFNNIVIPIYKAFVTIIKWEKEIISSGIRGYNTLGVRFFAARKLIISPIRLHYNHIYSKFISLIVSIFLINLKLITIPFKYIFLISNYIVSPILWYLIYVPLVIVGKCIFHIKAVTTVGLVLSNVVVRFMLFFKYLITIFCSIFSFPFMIVKIIGFFFVDIVNTIILKPIYIIINTLLFTGFKSKYIVKLILKFCIINLKGLLGILHLNIKLYLLKDITYYFIHFIKLIFSYIWKFALNPILYVMSSILVHLLFIIRYTFLMVSFFLVEPLLYIISNYYSYLYKLILHSLKVNLCGFVKLVSNTFHKFPILIIKFISISINIIWNGLLKLIINFFINCSYKLIRFFLEPYMFFLLFFILFCVCVSSIILKISVILLNLVIIIKFIIYNFILIITFLSLIIGSILYMMINPLMYLSLLLLKLFLFTFLIFIKIIIVYCYSLAYILFKILNCYLIYLLSDNYSFFSFIKNILSDVFIEGVFNFFYIIKNSIIFINAYWIKYSIYNTFCDFMINFDYNLHVFLPQIITLIKFFF